MVINWKSNLIWSAYVAIVGAIVAGLSFAALQFGSDNGADPIVVHSPTGEAYMVTANTPQSPAPERAAQHASTANKARAILPCREEDGSNQRAMCVWNDGSGNVVVNISRRNGADDRTVVLIDRTPNRR